MSKVQGTDMVSIFKEAGANNKRKIKVVFFPAWDEKTYGTMNLPDKLKKSMQKNKVSIFDIPDDVSTIVSLQKSLGKDVKSIEWV